MSISDRPFLEPNATSRYAGLRTKPINKYRFLPWGKIAVWAGALGAAAVGAAWLLSRYALGGGTAF
jgi:hypothetical protein